MAYDSYRWETLGEFFAAYEHAKDSDGMTHTLEHFSDGKLCEVGAGISLMDAHALSRIIAQRKRD